MVCLGFLTSNEGSYCPVTVRSIDIRILLANYLSRAIY